MKKLDKTGNFLNSIVILSFITAFSLSSAALAQAGNALLSGIEINPSDNNSYQIVLKSDKKVPFKKIVTADDKIVLELSGIKAAGNVETIYNNAANIDHVIVHPSGNDSVRIFLQGSNVSSSKIAFENQPGSLGFLSEPASEVQGQITPQETVSENTAGTADNTQTALQAETQAQVIDNNNSAQNKQEETIVLDKPVSNFSQNSLQSNPLAEEENADTSLTEAYPSLGMVKNLFSKANLDWLLRFGVFILLIIVSIKLLKPRKNIKIDLSTETKSRDISLLNSLNRDILSRGTGNMPSLKAGASLKASGNTLSNYGIREYQNSQVSPYKNSSGLQAKGNYTASGLSKPKPFTKVPSSPILSKPSSARTNTLVRPAVGNGEMIKAKSNVDSMKFLETMAKIYERNGRADLAQNINSSIAQGRQNIKNNLPTR
jgi:hypothetical protein